MDSKRNLHLGYKLSSEEFPANELVRYAQSAEEHGFEFALISDHFHPWTDRQGQSPFVWATIGGIAQTTHRLVVGTGVTCPTHRMHPATVAQAAATVATMMPGRFFLGLGTGENLNEHILGQPWNEVDVRQEKLGEAIQLIRLLWQGGLQSHHGKYFDVENARIYSLPEQPAPILVAAAGPKSTELAIRLGDGLIGTQPDADMIKQFRKKAGSNKPCYAEITVCFDSNERRAQEVAHEIWAFAELPGPLTQELPLPSHFEKAATLITKEKLAEDIPCGPEPDKHIQAIRKYVDAGYDHICVHQIGPKQFEFMDFYAREVFPKLHELGERAPAA